MTRQKSLTIHQDNWALNALHNTQTNLSKNWTTNKGPKWGEKLHKKAKFGWLQSTETTFVITNKMGTIEEWIYGGWLQRNVTHTLWKSIKTEVGYEDLIS